MIILEWLIMILSSTENGKPNCYTKWLIMIIPEWLIMILTSTENGKPNCYTKWLIMIIISWFIMILLKWLIMIPDQPYKVGYNDLSPIMILISERSTKNFDNFRRFLILTPFCPIFKLAGRTELLRSDNTVTIMAIIFLFSFFNDFFW